MNHKLVDVFNQSLLSLGALRTLGLILTSTLLVACGFVLLHPAPIQAMPLPTRLIDEIVLTSDQQQVEFSNVASLTPTDSRHLLIEVLSAATRSDGQSSSVRLLFNNDDQGNYFNRILYAEGGELDTNIKRLETSANLMKIPPAGGSQFGGGQSFIPWAFLSDQKKHLLTQGAANEDYSSMSMSHWSLVQPVSSIQLYIEGGFSFAAGSHFRLYVVDETYRINEIIFDRDKDGIDFSGFSQAYHNLIVIGQTRSNQVKPSRKGDRVFYSINGDTENSHYRMQRLTGESMSAIPSNSTVEPRVAWNSAESAPHSVYGPWLLYFPEYTNPNTWQTFLSRHGVYDDRYNPVGNETGHWANDDRVTDLRFYPQNGEAFKAGSRAGLYRTAEPTQRYVVVGENEQSVTLTLPAQGDRLQFHIAARSVHDESNEDRLLIEINHDDIVEHYARQRASASNGRASSEAERANNNEMGIMPSGSTPTALMSNTYISMMGFRDNDKQTAILSYGGASGSGPIAFYGGRWKQTDPVTHVTFRVASGAAFAPGSVFTIWADDPVASMETNIVASKIILVILPILAIAAICVWWITGAKAKPKRTKSA